MEAGQRLGRYRLVTRLGKGGMGEVWSGEDETLKRKVAIKVIAPSLVDNTEVRARFMREAQAAAQLTHPNVAQIFDVGEHKDSVSGATTAFLALEYVDGVSLRIHLLKQGPHRSLPAPEAATLALAIAEGLGAVHASGIVHRDFKPENIMITRGVDGREIPKLLDFGIAKVSSSSSARSLAPTDATEGAGTASADALTETGMVVGTPQYMSPEQASGRPVDARSDVFAFGAVLVEMLTGAPAFSGNSSFELIASILRDPPRSLPSTTPPALASIVARCLDKDPARRFVDARPLAEALRAFVSASTSTDLAPSAPTEAGTPIQIAPTPTRPTTTSTSPPAQAVTAPTGVAAIVPVATSTAQRSLSFGQRIVVALVAIVAALAGSFAIAIVLRELRHDKTSVAKATSANIPAVSSDIEVQQAWASAVKSFWNLDTLGAQTKLVDLERRTGSLPPLAYALLAFITHDVDVATKGLRVAKPDSRDARLLTMMIDAFAGKLGDDLARNLEGFEDTFLERAIVVFITPSNPVDKGRRLQAMLDEDPSPPYLWVRRASFVCSVRPPPPSSTMPAAKRERVDEMRAYVDECDRAIGAGMKATGGHDALVDLRGRTEWFRGDLERAHTDFATIVKRSPDDVNARVAAAAVALSMMDGADAARDSALEQQRSEHVTHLLGMTAAHPELVVARLTAHALWLAAFGRAKDADALLDELFRRARAGKLTSELLGLHEARLRIDLALERDDVVDAHVKELERDTESTGLLALNRAADDLHAWAEVMSSYRHNELTEKHAIAMLAHVDDALLPRPWTKAKLALLGKDAELAGKATKEQAQHFADDIDENLFSIKDGDPASFSISTQVFAGELCGRAHDDACEQTYDEEAQGSASACLHEIDERQILCRAELAHAFAGGARLRSTMGSPTDREDATASLDELHTIWPHADDDLPAMKSAASTRAALAKMPAATTPRR